MCIRDRDDTIPEFVVVSTPDTLKENFTAIYSSLTFALDSICLLYTSDAADERSSVDLGGRRIIKKKTRSKTGRARAHTENNAT